MAAVNAALELARAADRIRLLQQCERATGRIWVGDGDRFALLDAHARFTGRTTARLNWERRDG